MWEFEPKDSSIKGKIAFTKVIIKKFTIQTIFCSIEESTSREGCL